MANTENCPVFLQGKRGKQMTDAKPVERFGEMFDSEEGWRFVQCDNGEYVKLEAYEAVKRERNVFAGKYRSIVALMNKTRRQVQEIFDHIEDEGDRAYFGSTNHSDWLSDMLKSMDRWSFDAMLPSGDINKMEADPYATIREQRARAEAAERERDEAQAEAKRLREMLDEAGEALKFLTSEASVANDVIRLKRDGSGNGRVKIATILHRIERDAGAILTKIKEQTDASE